MIRAISLAILLSSSAQAGTILTIGNEAGTGLRFTDVPCDEAGLVVFTTARNGQFLPGCYALEGGDLYVRWQTGEVYVYKLSDAEMTEYARERFAE